MGKHFFHNRKMNTWIATWAGFNVTLFLVICGIVVSIILLLKVRAYWEVNGEKENEKRRLFAQFASIAIGATTVLATMYANQEQTLSVVQEDRKGRICQNKMQLREDIVDLVASVSHKTLREIGIPKSDFRHEGGTKAQVASSYEAMIAFQKLELEREILRKKLALFSIFWTGNYSAWNAYFEAVENFINKHGEIDDEYRQMFRRVNDEHDQLIESLNEALRDCL